MKYISLSILIVEEKFFSELLALLLLPKERGASHVLLLAECSFDDLKRCSL